MAAIVGKGLNFRAIAAAACIALFLGACAPVRVPAGPPVDAPKVQNDIFVAADGAVLPVRRWLPEGDHKPGHPRGVILAVHGFNDYSKAFDAVPDAPGVGPFLAARGFAVYAYDQRGFGNAPHFGFWPGSEALTADFGAFVRVLHVRYPGVPVYGLGESMGGAVIMTAMAASDPPPLNGVVLVAPAVWGRATMPWLYRVALWVSDHVMPGWKPTGRSLGRQASDNIEMLRDNARDPLFIKRTRIDSVAGLVDLMDSAARAAGRQRLPMLYLTGSNDQIIPPKAAALAMDRLLAADRHAKGAFYDQSWHMMLRDHEGPTVLADIAAYLNDPAAPLPSGADVDALARLQARAKKPWVEKTDK